MQTLCSFPFLPTSFWRALIAADARTSIPLIAEGRLFDVVQGFLLSAEDASYQQVAASLGLSLGAIKTAIHRMRNRYRVLGVPSGCVAIR
jgi:hypothetical protein